MHIVNRSILELGIVKFNHYYDSAEAYHDSEYYHNSTEYN